MRESLRLHVSYHSHEFWIQAKVDLPFVDWQFPYLDTFSDDYEVTKLLVILFPNALYAERN